MLRFLILILLLVLLWRLLGLLARRSAAVVREAFGGGAGRGASSAAPPTVTLSRCSACGVHVPSSRALPSAMGGRVYCSEACRSSELHAAS